MGYAKKSFDGKYASLYDKIQNNKKDIVDMEPYTKILPSLEKLEWQGATKERITNKIGSVDRMCNSLYSLVSINVEKVRICNGVLFENLQSLKDKINEYNYYVDRYNNLINKPKDKGGENG